MDSAGNEYEKDKKNTCLDKKGQRDGQLAKREQRESDKFPGIDANHIECSRQSLWRGPTCRDHQEQDEDRGEECGFEFPNRLHPVTLQNKKCLAGSGLTVYDLPITTFLEV
jgi:hypothetical protein